MTDNKQSYGVIFDMDGVLIESYAPHFESWQATAREYGQDMTETLFARQFGRTSREIIADLWGHTIRGEAVGQFDRRKEEIYRDLIRHRVPATPGLQQLLAALADNGAKMAVGSSGPLENVDLVLDALNIRRYFSGIVSARDVTQGKPHPQVFLTAAQRIDMDPARCVVIEDAVPGIEAAHRAGMKAIGLTTSHPAEKLTAADYIAPDLKPITPHVIHTLLNKGPQ